MKYKVENSQRYENRFKNQSIKLSRHCSLHYEDYKIASLITIDYENVWIHDRNNLLEILLLLTNWKSQNMTVLDFKTIYDTNLIEIIVDYDKPQAREFARRFLSYIPTEQIIKIVSVEEIEMFEIDLLNYHDEDKFIKINR